MRGISTEQLVRLWEQGIGRHPTERALLLLRATGRDRRACADADVALGDRDRLLLELRAETIGPILDAVASCGRCGARMEVECRIDALLGEDDESCAHVD